MRTRVQYFELLVSWRWELPQEDRVNVAKWFDKDANAMLVFVTMLTPHVHDSTRPLEEGLPQKPHDCSACDECSKRCECPAGCTEAMTKEEITEQFTAQEKACAQRFLHNNDERSPLHSCAACGIRDPTMEYTRLPINSHRVERYQYSEAEEQHFAGSSATYRKLKSSYLFEGHGRFHFHQELVQQPPLADSETGLCWGRLHT